MLRRPLVRRKTRRDLALHNTDNFKECRISILLIEDSEDRTSQASAAGLEGPGIRRTVLDHPAADRQSSRTSSLPPIESKTQVSTQLQSLVSLFLLYRIGLNGNFAGRQRPQALFASTQTSRISGRLLRPSVRPANCDAKRWDGEG